MSKLKCKKCGSEYIHGMHDFNYQCVACGHISEYNIDELANTSWYNDFDSASEAFMKTHIPSVRQIDIEADELINKIKRAGVLVIDPVIAELLKDIVEFVRRNVK